MKENVLDVLMYLFETYVDTEEDPEPDQNELRMELSRRALVTAKSNAHSNGSMASQTIRRA